MSVMVEVGLLSGKAITLEAHQDEQVEALALRAQIALGVGKGRLLDSSGNVLDACATIKDARVQSSDFLTLHRTQVQVQASDRAFAAVLGDGSVVAWGDADYGGDSSAVQGQLKNVREVQSTDKAFTAILADGSVVTWGGFSYWGAGYCGDSGALQVRAPKAALLWGHGPPRYGGAGPHLEPPLQGLV